MNLYFLLQTQNRQQNLNTKIKNSNLINLIPIIKACFIYLIKQSDNSKMLFDRDKPMNQQNLPFIFHKIQQQENDSNKSLYKNDSQSSHLSINPQNLHMGLNRSMKQTLNAKSSYPANNDGLGANFTSIKKYLKKGEEFNRISMKKIFRIEDQGEQTITKMLGYKLPKDFSIYRLQNQPDLQQKSNEKSLKKIYLSQSKNNKSKLSQYNASNHKNSKRFSTLSKLSQPKHLKKLVNQEVQTQKVPQTNRTKKPKAPQNLSSKPSVKINALQLSQKQQVSPSQNVSHRTTNQFINLSSILQKDEEEPQPPKKLNAIRHNHLQTKYLINQSFSGQQSTAPSLYTNTYLDSMSKLSSNFNSDVQRIKKNRYEWSDRSQTYSPERYSKTIQVITDNQRKQDPLFPDRYQNELKNPQQPQPFEVPQPFPKSRQKTRNHKQNTSIQEQSSSKPPHQLITTDQNDLRFEDDRKTVSLSIVPEQSQTGNSYQDANGFEPFSALSIVNEQQDQFGHNYHGKNQSEREKRGKNKTNQSNTASKNISPKKIDSMMQFPQISELKISPPLAQSNQNHRLIHPVRNNFNQKGISWITDTYRPKSKLFDLIKFDNFVIKKYRNGVYFGQLMEGKKHGHGIVFYYNGKIFQGKFDNDLKNGEGYEEFPDGSKYQGQFKDGTKSGKGVFEWVNGEVYEGQWLHGKKHGSGIWKSAEGQSYIGEWNNGQVEGFGVYISKLGDRYEGEFQNSQKQGFGTQRYHNGETYVGEYRKNRPNGQGQYFWTNGNYYKGDFVNHLRHGSGYFKDAKTGEQYKGQYRNDKKCGYGELKTGQTTYAGNFQNDYKHGYGELYQNQECKYKGYWINGKQLEQEEQQVNQQPEGLHQTKFESISEKPELAGHQNKARINRIQSKRIQSSKVQNNRIQNNRVYKPQASVRSILAKSKSPKNKSIQHSIQSLENNSLQKSNYKRSCGCQRRH